MLKLSITVWLLSFYSLANSQKIFDSIARETCVCIEKLPKDSTGYIITDSVTRCISLSVVNHFEYFRTSKKYPLTVEGIQRVNQEVMDRLKKTCLTPVKKE